MTPLGAERLSWIVDRARRERRRRPSAAAAVVGAGSLSDGDGGNDESDTKPFRHKVVQGGANNLGHGADVAVTAKVLRTRAEEGNVVGRLTPP